MSWIRTKHIEKGFVAGFVATIAVVLLIPFLMLTKQRLGLAPAVKLFALLTAMSGAPAVALLAAWVIYFAISSIILGGGFALLQALVPGPPLQRGVEFAIGAWLILMMVVLPMAGVGPFASRLGPIAGLVVLWMTLAAQVVFGLGALVHQGYPRPG
jgi:uncharacterized membrane protein YagU involved in acid resistance